MESDDDKSKEKGEEEMINEGPLSLLKEAVRTNSQILIYCRNNRKLLGRIRAFDRHMNIILEAVCEIWSEMMKGKNKTHKLRNRERFISKMFLRGDSIILIVKNPNEAKTGEDKDKKEEKEEEKIKDEKLKEEKEEEKEEAKDKGIKLKEEEEDNEIKNEKEENKGEEKKKEKKSKKKKKKMEEIPEDTSSEIISERELLKNRKRKREKEKDKDNSKDSS
jgi:small nuclear ribonucleoprotein D2